MSACDTADGVVAPGEGILGPQRAFHLAGVKNVDVYSWQGIVGPKGLPADVDKIVFPVSIYDAEARSQNFGQVRNAYIRIVNQAGGAEVARYDLSEDAATETAMVFGELYRNGAEWKFRAVGQGYASGLVGIAQDFGVNV